MPPIIRLLLAVALLPAGLHALQLGDRELVSPVTGERFSVVTAINNPNSTPGPADMGTDVDGCRHSSGPSEYDYAVVVDPGSFFAALTSEFDARTGQLPLPADVVEWVRKQWNSDLEIDRNRAFHLAAQMARASGQPPPDRATFVIPQNAIPIEKRYRLALAAYERRGARAAVLAKLALSGAWAVRARAQVPVGHPSLQGGYEEVNTRIQDQIKDGEAFDLAKWLPTYRRIVEKDGLTREGYTVAALALFGLELRDGNAAGIKELITKAGERLGRDDKPDVLRGLIRERKRLAEEHDKFLLVAAQQFTSALANEEIVRQRIPEVLLVVGESYRRTGNPDRAHDWLLALSNLPETQPAAREALRNEGRRHALPADRPLLVQLGWIADEQRERLVKEGLVPSGEIGGPDRSLLTAIVSQGLGTARYSAPGWRPAQGGRPEDCAGVLDLCGRALIDHAFRLGSWPKELGDLWEREIIRDRNRVNRFHCPATGKPLVYAEPPGDVSRLAPTTVLLATSEPLETPQGRRYAAFLLSTQVVWSEIQPVVGQPFPAQAKP